MTEETTQLQLIPGEEELAFELREMPLEMLAHIETPVPPKRELIESVRLIGMLQPPIFREDDAGHLDIVIGRRRLAAARIVGLGSIRIFVAKTSAAVADVMTLAENAIRSANTITEFEAIERLTKQGYDIKRIRAMTGMAVQTIKKRQALLRLSPDLSDAFKQGKMTATVADGAAKLPPALQSELALALVEKDRITAVDLHEIRQASTQAAMQSSLFDDEEEAVALEGEADASVQPDPLEYVLAAELQSIIDRMPEHWDAWRHELSVIASGLMRVAMGEYTPPDPDPTPVVIPPTSMSITLPETMRWRDSDGIEREIDTKYADVEVERPERVFTLTRIVEPAPKKGRTKKEQPPKMEQSDDEFLTEVFDESR